MFEFDLFDIFVGVFHNLLGSFFWAFILFLTVMPIWFKTKSFGPTFMVFMFLAIVFDRFLPMGEIRVIIFFGVVFGILYTLYRVFVKKISKWS